MPNPLVRLPKAHKTEADEGVGLGPGGPPHVRTQFNVNVAVARVDGLIALYITDTHFSALSGVGFRLWVARIGIE